MTAASEGTVVPQRVEIFNNTGEDRQVNVEFLDGWSAERRQAFSLFAPAGKIVTTVVYPDSDTATLYRLANSPRTISGGPSVRFHGSTSFRAVLQKELGKDWSLLKDDAYDGGVSEFDLMEWPADARMYLSQTHLIIPAATYETRFDEAHRRAIRQWVLSGGQLLLIRDAGTPAAEEELGAGKILRLPDFSFEGLDQKEKDRRVENFVKRYLTLEGSLPIDYPGFNTMPTAPAWLGLILLLFAVLTGPVCLFWWAPAGKRHRLFVLIPALSAAFSLLLLLLILTRDGTGGHGSRSVRIYVNPADHTAMIIQNQTCRTSVLMKNTFDLPENVVLFGQRYDEDTSLESLKRTWRAGGQCGGDWFTSRSQLHHRLLLPVSTRAAVTLVAKTPEGAPVFQSTFPTALTHLIYMDGEGKAWHIDMLPPAEKKAASPGFSAPGAATSADIAHDILERGQFMANMRETQGELGPIPTLPSIRWKKTDIVVSGPVIFSNLPDVRP